MIQIDMDISGFASWMHTPTRKKTAQLRTLLRRIDKQALSEWVLRKNPGLMDRFSDQHSARLGLTQRGTSTTQGKIKKFGRDIPYFSARNGVHMRDLVKSPAGHRVASRNGTTNVVTRLFLPGARILNRPGKDRIKSAIYRGEFVDMKRAGAAADIAWIAARRAELFAEGMNKIIAKSQRRRGRPRKVAVTA